jgi:hypothetical protein
MVQIAAVFVWLIATIIVADVTKSQWVFASLLFGWLPVVIIADWAVRVVRKRRMETVAKQIVQRHRT